MSFSKTFSSSTHQKSEHPRRIFIKSESKRLWREKFKQQCLRRVKESRTFAFNDRRLGFWKIANQNDTDDEDEVAQRWFVKKILEEWKIFWNDDNLDAVEDMIDDELLQEIMQGAYAIIYMVSQSIGIFYIC
ncbi:2798_t:CDS:2 [Cetraspora pellucida]|uniref:2798_t:CDS:1 n=2 Tax=Cetraspora pellucida TaxID=1433469 RepID=A0ACA9LA67_9GLOM|nr:2797_t:CDS:2 [Cetraspora pellucida]CAG8513080.1 2798_t:CDS:2 [Cetraspora pellucida]